MLIIGCCIYCISIYTAIHNLGLKQLWSIAVCIVYFFKPHLKKRVFFPMIILPRMIYILDFPLGPGIQLWCCSPLNEARQLGSRAARTKSLPKKWRTGCAAALPASVGRIRTPGSSRWMVQWWDFMWYIVMVNQWLTNGISWDILSVIMVNHGEWW